MRTREPPASRAAKAAWSRIARPASPRAWAEASGLFALFAIAAAFISGLTGAAALDPAFPGLREPRPLIVLALVAFIVPALGEELMFRNLLQPRTLSGARGVVLSGLSLASFVAWHPVQLVAGLPTGQPLFLEPGFLAIAGLLGLVCTISVHRSGSIWPAVVMHWLTVIVWKAGGG